MAGMRVFSRADSGRTARADRAAQAKHGVLTLLILVALVFAAEGAAQVIRPYLREVVCAISENPTCETRTAEEEDAAQTDVIGRIVTKVALWTDRSVNRVAIEIRRIYRAAAGRSDIRGPARDEQCPPALCPRDRIPIGPRPGRAPEPVAPALAP